MTRVTSRPHLRLSGILCLSVILICSAASADRPPPDYAPGALIVKFASDYGAEIEGFVARSGAYSAERAFRTAKSSQPLSRVYVLEFSPFVDIPSLAHQFENDPLVEYAQPNYVNHLCSTSAGAPNDSLYEYQWALPAIEALKAWKIEKGSRDVIIAVVDTGVDYNHEDLKSRIWINDGEIENNGLDDDGNGYVDDIRGWDFTDSPGLDLDVDHIGRDNDPMDEDAHGTHVAGIAAAIPNNSTGTAGVTWNCRIMAVRAGDKSLEDDDLAAAIVYAADNGAHVINMSWGSGNLSYIIRDALEYAYNRGCVLVAAAGNDDSPITIYPALHKHVIAVGATEKKDRKASFSNYGMGIDIAAPGSRIFSTTPNDRYSDWSGTSMASPVVSGVAALMLSRRPALTNEEVRQILLSTADRIDEPLFAGAGRVNAFRALTASCPLTASIASPDNMTGADRTVTIIGTAAGSHFRSFQLEYLPYSQIESFTSFPDMDWNPVSIPQNTAAFDEVVGTWNTADLDEGYYLLRLRVSGDDYAEAEDRLTLRVDHSPPVISELKTVRRIDYHAYKCAVTWWTDDPTSGELYCRKAGSGLDFQRMVFSSVTREHSVYASDLLPQGDYEYFVAAANTSGLVTIDDNDGEYYPLEIRPLRLEPDGFAAIVTEIPAAHPISGASDFDGDGLLEIVCTRGVKWVYDVIRVYERDKSGKYSQVFESEKDFFPWDIGDTDGDGLIEILGNRNGATFLYESLSAGSYPTEIVWQADYITGGQMADMDQDGRKEIVARRLDLGEIYVYENRGDNSYLRAARMENPTEGNNELAAMSAIADFDGDGRTEIVVGDQDGDLFIYENTDDDRYSHTWTGSIPHSEIEYVTNGDVDGDGREEFVVCSRAAGLAAQVKDAPDVADDPEDSATLVKNRWIYTIFDSHGADEYEAVWSEEILGYKSSSGLSVGDVNDDGKDEIVALVTPNIYIFKYVADGIFRAIWYHSASKTQWPIIEDISGDGTNEILCNDEDGLVAFRWTRLPGTFPQSPWWIDATPLSETEVEVRWNGPPDASAYRIYRGVSEKDLGQIASLDVSASGSANIGGENWELIRETYSADTGRFRDSALKSGVTYWYAVASVNASGRETGISAATPAMPNSPPRLLSAEYIPPSILRLRFSEAMGPLAQNEALYSITSEAGFAGSPSSAILDSQSERVVLTANALPAGIYTVSVSEVRDVSGVSISSSHNSAAFEVSAPETQEWTGLNSMIVYPNPVLPSSRHFGCVTFDHLPPNTTINIYDYTGELVRNLPGVGMINSRMLWYLDNEQHEGVASGIYIYIAECAGVRKSGKLALAR